MTYEEPMPHWALSRVMAGFPDGSQLLTKDGRQTGNAYLSHREPRDWCKEGVAVVVTDAGNIMRLTNKEIMERFYPPKYRMEPLPTHRYALESEKHDHLQ